MVEILLLEILPHLRNGLQIYVPMITTPRDFLQIQETSLPYSARVDRRKKERTRGPGRCSFIN